jgi:hypothetical protein
LLQLLRGLGLELRELLAEERLGLTHPRLRRRQEVFQQLPPGPLHKMPHICMLRVLYSSLERPCVMLWFLIRIRGGWRDPRGAYRVWG